MKRKIIVAVSRTEADVTYYTGKNGPTVRSKSKSDAFSYSGEYTASSDLAALNAMRDEHRSMAGVYWILKDDDWDGVLVEQDIYAIGDLCTSKEERNMLLYGVAFPASADKAKLILRAQEATHVIPKPQQFLGRVTRIQAIDPKELVMHPCQIKFFNEKRPDRTSELELRALTPSPTPVVEFKYDPTRIPTGAADQQMAMYDALHRIGVRGPVTVEVPGLLMDESFDTVKGSQTFHAIYGVTINLENYAAEQTTTPTGVAILDHVSGETVVIRGVKLLGVLAALEASGMKREPDVIEDEEREVE